MIVVLVIFSLGLLGLIIFFAVSPKSSRLLRLSAIIALGAICLSIIICGIIIFIGPAQDPRVVPLPVFPDSPAPAEESRNRVADIIIPVALLLLLGLVIVKASRDQRKMPAEKKAAVSRPVFHDTNELDDLEHQEPGGKTEEDESFDIDL